MARMIFLLFTMIEFDICVYLVIIASDIYL